MGSAVLPILLGGRCLGVLVLDFHEPHVFTPAEQQFLMTLAVQCAVALDRSTQHARLLQQQQQQLEVLESISDAFYAVDDAWRLTYINRRAEELRGRSRSDLIGQVLWEAFPQAVGSAPYQAHLHAAQERRPVRLEAESPVMSSWISMTVYPTASGLSVYFSDISERKTIETRERNLTRTLERRVAERTRDLQDLNAQLRAYAISIAHDLSEPLRRVHAFLGLFESRLAEQLDERAARLMGKVREETRRMRERLDELRHLAVLERQELSEEPLSLDRLIVQVRSDLEPLLKDRKVRWVLGPLPGVMGDRLLLRQVFAELLAVALDATRDGKDAVIEVEGEVTEGEVQVRFRHNGLTLGPDEAGRVFDVFHAPDKGFAAEERIGLANVRRIVTRHGGRVWAEAHQDGPTGATLVVVFPDRLGERRGP